MKLRRGVRQGNNITPTLSQHHQVPWGFHVKACLVKLIIIIILWMRVGWSFSGASDWWRQVSHWVSLMGGGNLVRRGD